ALRRRGLRAVTLSELLASAASTRPTDSDAASVIAPAARRASAAASIVARAGVAGHDSFASSGARAIGTSVANANTTGATWVTRRRWRADISLGVPTPDATPIATAQKTSPAHSRRA